MAGNRKPPMKHELKLDLLFFVGMVVAVVLIRDAWLGESHIKTIPYSEFRSLLDKGEVKDLVVGRTRIVGAYASPGDGGKPQHFATVRVDPQIADEFAKRNVQFAGEPEPGVFENFLSWLLPTAGFILMWMFLLRPMASGQGGLMGIGRSRAKIYAERDVKTAFADVAGVDEAKHELTEVVGFLKEPAAFGRLGAHIPWACCWWGRRGPARRCWRARWRARPACRSSPSPAPSSSRCSSALAPRVCAISSSRRVPRLRPSSSSTSSMRSDARAASTSPAAVTTRRSRRSINSWPRWTASIRAWASSCSRRPTGRRCSILLCCVPDASTARCSSTAQIGPDGPPFSESTRGKST